MAHRMMRKTELFKRPTVYLMALILSITVFTEKAKAAIGEPDPSDPADTTLSNPLKDEFSSIPALLAQLLDLVVMIGVPIAILFLVYSGFLFVTARGSEDKLKKAKHILLYTVVGTALIVGAALIAVVIEGTVDQLQG